MEPVDFGRLAALESQPIFFEDMNITNYEFGDYDELSTSI